MSTASTMLDLRPPSASIDTQLQADTIDVLVEAARTAQQCADVCLQESEPPRVCISLALDTADLTMAAANIVIRMSDPRAVAAMLEGCCELLRRCGDECRRHGSHLRQCAVCADVCSRAEEQCVRVIAVLTSSSPASTDDPRPAHEARPEPSPAARPADAAPTADPDVADPTEAGSAEPESTAADPTAGETRAADPFSPGAALGRSGAAPEPNEPA